MQRLLLNVLDLLGAVVLAMRRRRPHLPTKLIITVGTAIIDGIRRSEIPGNKQQTTIVTAIIAHIRQKSNVMPPMFSPFALAQKQIAFQAIIFASDDPAI
jgi:hypothetical protein